MGSDYLIILFKNTNSIFTLFIIPLVEFSIIGLWTPRLGFNDKNYEPPFWMKKKIHTNKTSYDSFEQL